MYDHRDRLVGVMKKTACNASNIDTSFLWAQWKAPEGTHGTKCYTNGDLTFEIDTDHTLEGVVSLDGMKVKKEIVSPALQEKVDEQRKRKRDGYGSDSEDDSASESEFVTVKRLRRAYERMLGVVPEDVAAPAAAPVRRTRDKMARANGVKYYCCSQCATKQSSTEAVVCENAECRKSLRIFGFFNT